MLTNIKNNIIMIIELDSSYTGSGLYITGGGGYG
jgi:hypothetical protein